MVIVELHLMTRFFFLGTHSANYATTSVVELFITMVIKLHDIPNAIVSDHDKVFMGKFW